MIQQVWDTNITKDLFLSRCINDVIKGNVCAKPLICVIAVKLS